ncbi:MAG: chemotaxis protein CheX [Desulfobacteraceae bacterium 4572_19]|nr:MAG: chemotaxis protein CheX [Desulfobacteraceae bacterium 4572_19]
MNEQFVNPFIEAALYILETTASVKVKPLPPYRKSGKVVKGAISGLIEMGGDVTGSIVICFTEKCILGIVSGMFGEEMTDMNDEIKDAVGEVVNMISGQVSTKMAEKGKTCDIKLKDVIMGKDHSVEHLGDAPVIVAPFSSNMGNFALEICLAEK